MPTPRESFILSGKAAAFKAVVATDYFEIACDYAMLQLLSEQQQNVLPGRPVDPYVGLDANAQMKGAARVLEILKTLHEPVKPPTQEKRPSLNYNA